MCHRRARRAAAEVAARLGRVVGSERRDSGGSPRRRLRARFGGPPGGEVEGGRWGWHGGGSWVASRVAPALEATRGQETAIQEPSVARMYMYASRNC